MPRNYLEIIRDAVRSVGIEDDTGSPGWHMTCCMGDENHEEGCWYNEALDLLIEKKVPLPTQPEEPHGYDVGTTWDDIRIGG